MCHVLSILVLLLRLRVSKNAIGVSIKTQELYLVVFVTRYLDLFTTFYSVYNSVMKILYIASTAYIIYMVRRTEPFKTNFERAHDSFLHWQFAVAPCAVLAMITNVWQGFSVMEVSRGTPRDARPSVTLTAPPLALVVPVGDFHLPGGSGHRPAAHRTAKIPRGRKPDGSLCFPPRRVPCAVHRELGIPVVPRNILQAQLGGVPLWRHTDVLVRGLLLLLRSEVRSTVVRWNCTVMA